MSANASQEELIRLIYRHLKEHGYCSAAEELQRHSPQGETPISATLFEIYSSWLNDSPNKRQPGSAHHSVSEKQGEALAKAASKKKDKPVKKAAAQKKPSVAAKRKTSDSKSTGSAVKKPKAQTNVVAAGEDDSDSDSSLDVEKWKTLLLQMTETDVAKIDTINALDSCSPKNTIKRVRKSRAKPKSDTPVKQNSRTAVKNGEVGDEAVTEKQTRPGILKKTLTKNTAPTASSAPPSQENLNAAEHEPEASTLSPSPQKPSKEERDAVTPSKEKADESMSEQKKKKTEVSENIVILHVNETGEGGKKKDSKKKKKKKEVTESVFDDKSVVEDKTKAEGTNVDDEIIGPQEELLTEKNETGPADNETISEPIVREKKAKKKKKKKEAEEEKASKKQMEEADIESVSEPVLKNKKAKKKKREAEETAEEEQAKEKEEADIESVSEPVLKNKKSKKNKEVVESLNNSEQVVEPEEDNPAKICGEENAKRKKETADGADNSETYVKEKKSKKKKKNQDEQNSEPIVEESMIRKSSEGEEELEQIKVKKKKKKASKMNSVDLELIPPSNLETPRRPPTEKKKKKNKFELAEVPETHTVSAEDVTVSQTPSKRKNIPNCEDV